MTSKISWRAAVVASVTVGAMAACAGGPQAINGECRQVFGGDVCTFATMANGVLSEFGAMVPMTTVENTPMDRPMTFPPVPTAVIPLPAEAATATGFNHLSVHWELHGHPPAVFMTPHFDFHFYTTSPAEAAAIDCADLRKPASTPAGYVLPDIEIPGMGTLVGLCVPGMGMHGMPTAELDQADPFGATMIVGYYGTAPLFVEPMISKAKLLEGKAFDMVVPAAPAAMPAGVRWPLKFQAHYDGTARAYRFVFSM
jgi:hypothetical protein